MKGATDSIMQACIGIDMKAQGRVVSVLMKALCYDAMIMDNHELDFDALEFMSGKQGSNLLVLTSFSSWVH